MSAIAIISLIDTILMLATEIPALMQKAQVLKAEIQAIVAEGREPSPAEWDAVNAKTADMLGFLQSRADAAQQHLDEQGG